MATRQVNPVLRHIRELAAGGERTPLSDRQLLQRFLAHADHSAFEAVVRRHGPMVLRVCRSLLRDEHAADDAFQATFLVLARKAASLRRQELLGSWLYGVAHRVAARARVEAAKRRDREARAEPRTPSGPEADVGTREVCAALEEEMARLPERYRTPFYLCHVEGRTRDQAARQLDCSVRTLQRLLERGRSLLQARLTRRGVSLSAALLAVSLTQGAAPASVPAELLASTLAAALATSGAPPLKAAALADGVLRRMAGTRLKLLAALVLLTATAGAVLMACPGTPPEQAAPSVKAPAAPATRPQPATDRYGDPLPPGALLRLGSLRLRTGAPVFAVLPTPDGKGVFSGSAVPYVPLWDVATGKEVRRFELPQKPGAQRPSVLGSLALSPDGRTLAAATRQGAVHLWDAATARPLRLLTGPTAPVPAMAFAPDGPALAAVISPPDKPAEVVVWDTATGKERRRWRTRQTQVHCLAAAPDGSLLATAGEGATVQLWDAATGRPLQTLGGHGLFVWAVAFSPDGKRLAAAGHDEIVRLWDATTGALLHKFDAHAAEVRAVKFSPDGHVLAAAGNLRSLLLWDVASGKQLAALAGLRVDVRSLAFVPRAQGLRLATGNGRGTVEILDLPDRETLRQPAAGRAPSVAPLHSRGHRSGVYATAVSPDGKVIATGSEDCTVRLWDAATGKELRRLDGHIDWVGDLAFSPDGKYLVSGGNDGRILVREPDTGKVVRRLEGRCAAFSPDGRLLATATTTRTPAIQIWDFATGQELHRLHGHKAAIFRLAFSPDGKRLASSGMGVLPGLMVQGEEMEVNTIRLWDVGSGKLLYQFGDPHEYVHALTFTADGKALISGGDPRGEKDPLPIRLWETATGKERGRLPGHRDRVWSLALSPDGKRLASGSSDGTARLWDLDADRELGRLEGHRGWITAVAFGPGARTLVTGSWDTTALVWDVRGLTDRKAAAEKGIPSAELEALWADLRSDDAAVAYRAVLRMSAAPAQTVPLLQERLAPVPPPDAARVRELVAALGSGSYAQRQKATAELEKLGELAGPALREALTRKPALEVRRRVERLLDKASGPPTELRGWRALEVLERAGTPDACQLLRRLAGGAPGALLTEEARAVLGRLARRP